MRNQEQFVVVQIPGRSRDRWYVARRMVGTAAMMTIAECTNEHNAKLIVAILNETVALDQIA